MRGRTRSQLGPEPWTRRRLLTLLAAAALVVAFLVTGLGLSVYYMLAADPHAADRARVSTTPGDSRDELASRPMPEVPQSAARPGPLTTKRFVVIDLPAPRRLGPAEVSTGFPQTPQGALAQLVAIDQAALQSGSVPRAQEMIEAWALPGGPTAESWSGVRAIAGLLGSAGLPATGSPSLVISATPAMGLIKGTVDRKYVVACVNFVVTATLTQTARVAAADCQRMVWASHRWMVGPGSEPAQPPSVWPGTEAAHRAGYRELRYE